MATYTVSKINGDTVIGAERNETGTLAARVPSYMNLKNGQQVEGVESEYGITIKDGKRDVLCKYEIYTTTPRAEDFVRFGDGDDYR